MSSRIKIETKILLKKLIPNYDFTPNYDLFIYVISPGILKDHTIEKHMSIFVIKMNVVNKKNKN